MSELPVYCLYLRVTGNSQTVLDQNIEELKRRLAAAGIPFQALDDDTAVVQLLMRRYGESEPTVRQWLAEKDSVSLIVDEVIRGFRESPPDNRVSRWRKFHAGLPRWLRVLLPPYKYSIMWYRGHLRPAQNEKLKRSEELKQRRYE